MQSRHDPLGTEDAQDMAASPWHWAVNVEAVGDGSVLAARLDVELMMGAAAGSLPLGHVQSVVRCVFRPR